MGVNRHLLVDPFVPWGIIMPALARVTAQSDGSSGVRPREISVSFTLHYRLW